MYDKNHYNIICFFQGRSYADENDTLKKEILMN